MISQISTLHTISLGTILSCNSRGSLKLLENLAETGIMWSQLKIFMIAFLIALVMKIQNSCIKVDRLSGLLLLDSTIGFCYLFSRYGWSAKKLQYYLYWFHAYSCLVDGLRWHISVGMQNYYLILSKLCFIRAHNSVPPLNSLLILKI